MHWHVDSSAKGSMDALATYIFDDVNDAVNTYLGVMSRASDYTPTVSQVLSAIINDGGAAVEIMPCIYLSVRPHDCPSHACRSAVYN